MDRCRLLVYSRPPTSRLGRFGRSSDIGLAGMTFSIDKNAGRAVYPTVRRFVRAPPRREPFRPAASIPCGTPTVQREGPAALGKLRCEGCAQVGTADHARPGSFAGPARIPRARTESALPAASLPRPAAQRPQAPGCGAQPVFSTSGAKPVCGEAARPGSATGERSTYRTRRQEPPEAYLPAEREHKQWPRLSGWRLRIVKRAPQDEPRCRVAIGGRRLAPEERRLDRPLPTQSSTLRNPGSGPSAPPGKPCLWFDTPISCRQPIPVSRAQ